MLCKLENPCREKGLCTYRQCHTLLVGYRDWLTGITFLWLYTMFFSAWRTFRKCKPVFWEHFQQPVFGISLWKVPFPPLQLNTFLCARPPSYQTRCYGPVWGSSGRPEEAEVVAGQAQMPLPPKLFQESWHSTLNRGPSIVNPQDCSQAYLFWLTSLNHARSLLIYGVMLPRRSGVR